MPGFLSDLPPALGKLALVLLFLWGVAGMFQYLRWLIFAPLASKKEQNDD